MDDGVEQDLLKPDLAQRVLALPLFQGLPVTAQKLLRRFGVVERHRAGSEFVQQGEFTSAFHFVLDGLVTAFRSEPDGKVRRLVELGAEDWFGELSALSNQPSPARLRADVDTTVLTLESGLFKDLYKSGRAFREAIDRRYRERSLLLHLAVIPAFRALERADMQQLRASARFERVEEGAVIAREGDAVEAVHLVRSGAVTFHRREGAGERLDGYLMENSSFGEAGLWEPDARWDGTFRARTTVELLVLPVAEIRQRLAGAPQVLEALARAAERVTREDRGEAGAPSEDSLHGMVHRGSVKGGEALVIDLAKCVRCNACVESCVAVHEDRVPRLSKKGFRVAAAENLTGRDVALVTSCYHCQTPGCMMACSYGAIRRDPQGLIRFISDNCVGCAMCVGACPYDVIRLTEPPDAATESQGWLASLPVVGALFGGRKAARAEAPRTPTGSGFHKAVEVQGRAVKCDRCEGLPFEACVYNCPCGAIARRAPAEVFGGGGRAAEV